MFAPCGVDVIVGLNGYIWLTANPATAPDASSSTATPSQVKIQSVGFLQAYIS
mgnify:CR=1 FL=1